jgi:hypothetical protein
VYVAMIMFMFLSGACLFTFPFSFAWSKRYYISTECRKHSGSYQFLHLDPSPLVPRPLLWIPSWRLGTFLRGQKERERVSRRQRKGQKGKRCQKEWQNLKESSKKGSLTRVGFEPTHISVVEICKAGIKSTALDHSAMVSDGEIDQILNLDEI